jgi:hypothetical protein
VRYVSNMMIHNLSLVNILTSKDANCRISFGQSEASDPFYGRYDFEWCKTRHEFFLAKAPSFTNYVLVMTNIK